MQKKKVELQNSAWQDTLKKQERKDNIKKYSIWAIFGLVFLIGLGALVKMAGVSPSTSNPVQIASLPKVTDKDIIMGDKTAKTSVIEYADLQCPACASYNPIMKRLESDFKGRVKFVYRFFPLTSVHRNAIISAQASYAAHKQGKFSEMKDALYENQPAWENLPDPREDFAKFADKIGLDVERFKKDMNSDESKNVVLAGLNEANKLGLNSTPTFFINDLHVSPNGYDDFKKLIEQELK